MSVNRLLANLAQSLDSSSVGSFLSGDSADRFQTLQWTDVSGRPTVADSAAATSIIDSAYVQSRVTTYAVGLDSATTIALLDSDYIRSKVTNDVGFFIYHYDTTAGQTLLDSSNEASSNAISYTKDYVMVFKNGVLLDSASGDYTAISGNTVVLGAGADSGELVTVVKWAPPPPPAAPAGGGGPSFTGDRVLVQGGYMDGTNTYSNVIDYFSITASSGLTASDFGDLVTAGGYCAAAGDGSRNINTGRYAGNNSNRIDYFDYATLGNAGDFGDQVTKFWRNSGHGDGTYATFTGGTVNSDGWNSSQYVTVQTLGNATQSGNLWNGYYFGHAALCDGTYSVMAGGNWNTGGFGGTDVTNTIQYSTTSYAGNCSDFGDLTAVRTFLGACCDGTYGLFGGGYTGSVASNVIDYITVQTTSNATDFGDCSSDLSWGVSSASDGTYAVFCGGNQSQTASVIDRVVTATAGNATDIGDLSVDRRHSAASSGSPS